MQRFSIALFLMSWLAVLSAGDAVAQQQTHAASTPRHQKAASADETLTFGRFGTVTLYRAVPHPSNVVLFVSGDGGWNLGVVDMARELATLDALVVGIDIRHYLKVLDASTERCTYPAADLEALSQFVQQKLDFPRYTVPILVGFSSGATLVYALLVEAPPGTFAGAIGLGFCPDLDISRPMCRGHGLEWTPGAKGKGVVFLPAANLEAPFVALQGTIDQVCNPPATLEFVKKVKGGEAIMLPKVGHGFSVPRNWMPEFRQAYAKIASASAAVATPAPSPEPTATTRSQAAASAGETPSTPATAPSPASAPPPPESVADLPLVELPAQGTPTDELAVILSGDGGWAGIDREIGKVLASRGVAVVGLNSLQYFWTRRTPDGTAADLTRIIRHYLAAWHKTKLLLIGYSRGADVLPFLVARLPDELKPSVRLVALLGLEPSVEFEFHVADWVRSAGHDDLPVLPEINKITGLKLLCLYGEDEKDSLCPTLDHAKVTVVKIEGGHHFNGAYQSLADRILAAAR